MREGKESQAPSLAPGRRAVGVSQGPVLSSLSLRINGVWTQRRERQFSLRSICECEEALARGPSGNLTDHQRHWAAC